MGIDEYATRLIRIKAHQLVTKGGFNRSDRRDIEQELKLDLLERLPEYDPDKGSLEGFISGVVNHKISHLIERRRAAKRDPDRVEHSLNETISDGDGGVVQRNATVPDQGLPDDRQRDLALDLGDALADLPPHLRRVCHGLLQQANVTEIAQQQGVSRKTVYEWLKTIRAAMSERGLEDYL